MRPFEVYLRKLLELHTVMEAEAAGDSVPQGSDDLRDAMDGSWEALSPAEQRVMNYVSEGLYSDSRLDLELHEGPP